MQKTLAIAATLLFLGGVAIAEETTGEKVEASANNVKRAVKKTAHKIEEEIVCAQDDVECAKKKIANRTKEAGAYVKDKAKQIKNKIDSDKK